MPRMAQSNWKPQRRVSALQRGLGIDAEDGVEAELAAAHWPAQGFNGASASMPRMVVALPLDGRAIPAGFNVASASMPRMGSSASSQRERASWLQRGLGIDAEDGLPECQNVSPGQYASTGPRHRCRGWLSVLAVRVASGGASTGPRHRCRGWRLRRRRSQASRLASTGPRHRCRGWHPQSRPSQLRPLASTGPRHRCRGWGAALGRTQRRSGGFNGASASMPRMVPVLIRCCRFAWVLQRGLGIDAEDGELTVHRELPFVQLQRGLGIDAEDGAEWRVGSLRDSFRFNGASASMPRMGRTPCRTRGTAPGFNGASASMPRMALRWRLPGRRGHAASTGPRHRCRGWLRDPSAKRGVPRTSTGPRHRCRGWRKIPRCGGDGRSCFNGASASMPRMGPPDAAVRLRSGRASTGPRHRCRGWDEPRFIHAGASPASTGPRHRCRGW